MKPSPTQTALARLGAASATMIAIGIIASPSHAQCQYDVTVLQFPINCGIGTVITSGLSLNENGAVVGRYKCPISKFDRPFVWTADEGFTDLGLPPGVMGAIPTDINDQGVICGTMYVSGVGFRGFVYQDGVWTELPPVVDAVGAWSSAAAISNAGVVVGQRSITENLNPQNAYIWSAAEGFTDLGVMNGPNSAATDISDAGVVGWTGILAAPGDEAFLWRDGELTLLGPVPGGLSSSPGGLNNLQQVTGAGLVEKGDSGDTFWTSFLWDDGVFTLLGTLPGYESCGGRAIDDLTQITGFCIRLDNPNDRRAFLWRQGVIYDLNDLIRTDLSILIERAKAINNAGLILADGHDGSGDVVTFLLTPIGPRTGDLDGDCAVGIIDLLMLLASWGPCPDCGNCPADLDGDGGVGIFDLLTLIANWGPCP